MFNMKCLQLSFRLFWLLILAGILFGSCKKSEDDTQKPPEAPVNPEIPSFSNLHITTDKAAYFPGDEILFSLGTSILPSSAKVRYKHLNTLIEDVSLPGLNWTWKPPSDDFKGYLVEVYDNQQGSETIYASIGIDISSDWTKFPRYGFLSKFGQISETEINEVIENLNRHHINGIQFYDWMNKHHQPLPMEGSMPAATWKDIINRDIYFSTVQNYIAAAHSRNIKAMFYNLVYGAWENADEDGVPDEWFVFKDNTHTNKDFHPLSSPFLSNIYLLDPSNIGWQQYLILETEKVYQFLDFDGFHMDQLGDRGNRYTWNGTFLNLAITFKPFINAVKADNPQKAIVMNSVSQYGQQGIAVASSDFLYTEVWDPFKSFNDLSNLIKQNNTYSNNTKNTVLAAYINYDLANNPGYFNTASVLMANAVIFAFGGAHLELGEHMLGKEYFPNDNLAMKDELKSALISYYDFLVAYQNLLRDGGIFNTVNLSCTDGKIKLGEWPSNQGSVAVTGKKVENKQVIHLINFRDSKTTNFRDSNGIQPAPGLVKDASLVLTTDQTVKKVWMASPDVAGGYSLELNFAQSGQYVSFKLPELKYWTMLVVEY